MGIRLYTASVQTRSAAGPLFPLLPSIPRQQWPALLQGARGGDGDFRSLAIGGWRGIYTARLPANRPWSGLNDVAISGPEWQIAWPRLLAGIEGAWTRYKADASGAVAHGPITLAGREVVVYAKRPRRKRIGQWAVDLFRPARARRAWLKTWMMFTRGLPTEIPLLLMERRSGPWVVDNIVVFERVPGPMLHDLPLDDLPERARHDLLWGLGRILRAIDAHFRAHGSFVAHSTRTLIETRKRTPAAES